MSRVFRGACLNTVLENAIDKKKEMETAILYAYRMEMYKPVASLIKIGFCGYRVLD